MRKQLWMIWMVCVALSGSGVGTASAAEPKIRVLVVTGGHGFEREPFFRLFADNPAITFAHEAHARGSSTVFERADLFEQDVVVLYDMVQTITEPQKARFLGLLDRGVGLVVLHHALVSYQRWPEYERIIGGRYPEEEGKAGVVTEQVGYLHDVDLTVQIVGRDHPITAGLRDFPLHDEIYWGYRVGKDVTPLVTTSHPRSGKPLGWARTEKKSRIVYLQPGHGPSAYGNPHYRRLLAQSISWAARR